MSNTIVLFLPLGLLSLQFISITEKKRKRKARRKKENASLPFNVCKIYGKDEEYFKKKIKTFVFLFFKYGNAVNWS